MNGLLVVNKEKGFTSRDVVNVVGKTLGTKKIGHTGTLDPIATGVLVLCVGKSLKLVELLTNHGKVYRAKVRLGIETDTLDITGTVLKEENVCFQKEQIEVVLQKFVGKIKQQVPKYSAIKVNGKKLYEYARNHEEVELPVREVEIYDLRLISDVLGQDFWIECHVSRGTYIRSLIRDIGVALGTCATMVELCRIQLGNFKIDQAYRLEDIKRGNYQLLKPDEVLGLPKMIVSVDLERKIRNGQVLDRFFTGDMMMILDHNEELLAIYQSIDEKKVKPYRMFL